SNNPARVVRISAGSAQLLVGPASASFSEQMKVRDSTRATSSGLLRARKLYGRNSGLRRVRVPLATISRVIWSHSRGEPSHQTTLSGLVRAAMVSTHSATFCRVPGGRCPYTGAAVVACVDSVADRVGVSVIGLVRSYQELLLIQSCALNLQPAREIGVK